MPKKKVVKKAKAQKNAPVLSQNEYNEFREMLAKALGMQVKKEPRSQKRRGQVTGGDR